MDSIANPARLKERGFDLPNISFLFKIKYIYGVWLSWSRASGWGSEDREFKSRRPDHINSTLTINIVLTNIHLTTSLQYYKYCRDLKAPNTTAMFDYWGLFLFG